MLLMMGGDTTRNMCSSFSEINKPCNVASCWKYVKWNKLLCVVRIRCIFVNIHSSVTKSEVSRRLKAETFFSRSAVWMPIPGLFDTDMAEGQILSRITWLMWLYFRVLFLYQHIKSDSGFPKFSCPIDTVKFFGVNTARICIKLRRFFIII